MFKISKEITVSSAHFIKGHSTCGVIHGHNYKIVVDCESGELSDGMVCDFTEITTIVKELDHKNINDLLPLTTAECIAEYLGKRIRNCFRVTVYETPTSIAVWEK